MTATPMPILEPESDDMTKTTTTATTDLRPVRPVSPRESALTPLGLREVTIADSGFWGAKRSVNASATIAHCLYWQERAGWLGNFDAAAAGTLPGAHRGREFADSETYKLLEAMAWEIAVSGNAELDAQFLTVVARVGRAQEPDGYLNTNFGRAGQAPRYSDLAWGHELYNYGHLLQAAVARVRATGRDELFDIAQRVADHICVTFGPDGIDAICGHPEVEVGLVEFGRLTGDDRYIDQAKLFLDRRGHGLLPDIEFGRAYYQDDIPIVDATVLRGHAVRALYLSAAAVDVAVEKGDHELLQSLEIQWGNTVARRTYLTGGMGSHHQDEAFGEDYELPSDRAYCETCASVASIMFSWRLLLATANPEYADLIERTLFNMVATSPAPDGRSFFYANTLHQRTPGMPSKPDEQSPRAVSTMRAPWFDVSCCPHNVARTLASLSGYFATVTENAVQLHQYASGRIETELGNGDRVVLEVETEYPTHGTIAVTVIEAPSDPWTLELRVPGWCESATLAVGGESRAVGKGTVAVDRSLTAGDVVTLALELEPRLTNPDRRVDAIRGTIAVEVGPLVYCLESVDLPHGARLEDIAAVGSEPRRVGDSIVIAVTNSRPANQFWPYGDANEPAAGDGKQIDVPLVPYYFWANRGPSTMRVWVPTVTQ
jgi:DUF1680 family protein